jgi:hypothetical protein
MRIWDARINDLTAWIESEWIALNIQRLPSKYGTSAVFPGSQNNHQTAIPSNRLTQFFRCDLVKQSLPWMNWFSKPANVRTLRLTVSAFNFALAFVYHRKVFTRRFAACQVGAQNCSFGALEWVNWPFTVLRMQNLAQKVAVVRLLVHLCWCCWRSFWCGNTITVASHALTGFGVELAPVLLSWESTFRI